MVLYVRTPTYWLVSLLLRTLILVLVFFFYPEYGLLKLLNLYFAFRFAIYLAWKVGFPRYFRHTFGFENDPYGARHAPTPILSAATLIYLIR